MKASVLVVATSLVLAESGTLAIGQTVPHTPGQAKLALTVEIAATTDDGDPAALRVTLTNNGNTAVTMPLPSPACSPDNGVGVRATWISDDNPGKGAGIGGGCGSSDGRTLMQRVERNWICLRPGEYMTTTLSLRGQINSFGPGILEYWVEYTPPQATQAEISSLFESGYVIPTEALQSQHQSFRIH